MLSKVSPLLMAMVSAEPTMDHGQYHTHNPDPNVKDYKTGGPLTVHVVPHSHDDIGWLKTVDQYFYGNQEQIQFTNVNVELTSVMNALLDNPARKFSEVEMKFFSMWWKDQSDTMKDKVRGLVNNGQLELINGGWSMHDEACPTYEDMINNMMIGHDFILEEFGVKPRIGWQVDPFGHSNANARLFAEMGFDALFFGRLDYQDKNKRMNEKSMEWIWMPNADSLGTDVNLFTHAMYNQYQSPEGFDFDMLNEYDPWVNDKESDSFTAEKYAQGMMADIDDRAAHYLTDDIFVVFGGDFEYMNAFQNYASMDNMISYMNENYGDKYIFKYSTPSDYVDAVAKHDVKWPTKYDDMFPYSDSPDSYWTGYFSSRANDKEYIRRASSNFHSSSQLMAGKVLDQNADQDSIQDVLKANYEMQNELGVNQHHDAVTGTGKQAVANDYALKLFKGMKQNNVEYSKLIQEKMAQHKSIDSKDAEFSQCFATNSTYLDCPIANFAEEEAYTMTVFAHNPSPFETESIRVAVPNGNYKVFIMAYDGQNQQTRELDSSEASVTCHKDHIENNQEVESCFLDAKIEVPAWGMEAFQLVQDSSVDIAEKAQELKQNQMIKSASQNLEFIGSVEDEAKLIFKVHDNINKKSEILNFNLKWWASFIDYYGWDGEQNSGDYIFRPETGEFTSKVYSEFDHATISGNQMDFYFNKMNDNTQEIEMRAIIHVTIDEDLNTVKFEVDMDSLPPIIYNGWEVVAQFQVENFHNNGTFFTDSNGLEMQKRILNYRPTWDLVATNYADSLENVTANYFPIQSAISMKDMDSERMFTVMNDRSQGGSALTDGTIEFMQNRRIPADDSRGMGEWVNEEDELGNGIRVPATYHVQIFDNSVTANVQRKAQLMIDSPVNYFFTFDEVKWALPSSAKVSTLAADYTAAGVNDLVKFVTIPQSSNNLRVRLENTGDFLIKGAASATVDLEALIYALVKENNAAHVDYSVSITEKSTTGNMDIEEMWARKIQWQTMDEPRGPKLDMGQDFNAVKLELQRIRVFDVAIKTNEAISFLN